MSEQLLAGFPRFWSKVDFDGPIPEHRPELGPCWIWTRAKNSAGYGRIGMGANKTVLAHRLAYDLLVGDPGPELDHLCRNHACVNPAHLEPVAHRENVLRGESAQLRTHCSRGHQFTEQTTRYRPQSRARDCLICEKIRSDARPRKTARRASR